MSILIDDFIKDREEGKVTTLHKGNWYIAKPLSGGGSIRRFFKRCKDALRIITGKSFAVHYKEDELKNES